MTVSVAGADLGAAVALKFSDSRLKATPAKNAEGQVIANEFLLQIPEGVDAGLYEVWAVGQFGVSNSRLFAIGEFLELVDRSPKHAIETASPLLLGTSVSGRSVATKKNFYRVFLMQGQRLIVTAHGEGIDSRIEAVLELYDGNGRFLQKDRSGRLLDYTAGGTGPVFVSICDLTYRGGDQFFYRLTAHDGPQTDHVLPLSRSVDQTQATHVFGRNLLPPGEGKGARALGNILDHVVSPPEEWEGAEDSVSLTGVTHSVPGLVSELSHPSPTIGLSDGVAGQRIAVANMRAIVEEEVVVGGSLPQLLIPSVAVSGMFFPRHDVDVFDFEAKKGEEFWVEVRSSQLGFKTSPLILVERVATDGDEFRVIDKIAEFSRPPKDMGNRAFPLRSRDPKGLVTIKQDGRYRVSISDLFNLNHDQTGRLYELRIRRPNPRFRAYSLTRSTLHRNINRRAAVESLALLPGQVLPISVKVERLDGYAGAIEISATESPAGIEVPSISIPKNQSEGVIMIQAGLKATPAFGRLDLVAGAMIGGEKVSIPIEHGQVVWEVGDYNNDPVLTRLSPERRVSIGGASAFPLRVFNEKGVDYVWQVSRAGRVKIPFFVDRLGDFTEAHTFKIGGLEKLSKHPGLTVPKGGDKAVLEIDLAKYSLEPGSYQFYLYGEAKGKYRRDETGEAKDLTVSTYSPPVRLEVFAAPFALECRVPSFEIRGGQQLTIPIQLIRRFGFEGQVEVTTSFKETGASLKVTSTMLKNDAFDLMVEAPLSEEVRLVGLELKASGKLNGETVVTTLPLGINILAAE